MAEPGPLNPASPPRPTMTPALLTLPVAYEFTMNALSVDEKPLLPTRPPPQAEPPTTTLPCA